ncbi:MAG: SRPBCC domain-containing protein [Fimbriiglobus sp.]|nr:SRPBCC domain-containing protein [Fimbriiglobus sp.]
MSRPTDADRTLVLTRVFNAPRELVWKVWTDPKHVEKWWGPRGFTTTVRTLDLRPGGKSDYVMTGHDGAEYPVGGVFREVVPFERIVATDEFLEGFDAGGVELPQGVVTTVEFTDDGPNRTRLTLTITHPTAEEKAKHEAMGVVVGWGSTFDCLDEHLAGLSAATGEPIAPAIFVNLPVKDLKRSIAFYTALGARLNPQFSDDTAACLQLTPAVVVMALTEAKFRSFATKPIADATTTTQMELSLPRPSRADVDGSVRAAVAAGGAAHGEPADYGFMYQHGFSDPDGHTWGLIHMSGMPQ